MRIRRRLSTRPENVRRRLTNRVMQALAALIIAAGYAAWNTWFAPQASDAAGALPEAAPAASAGTARPDDGLAHIDTLFAQRRSNEMVTVQAPVARVLPDDNDGSRHQKFLIALPSGRNVLVAHNIDLAPRVADLAAGDRVTVRGEYEWEERGGVIHWTHHDPAGRHQGGWIEKDGRRHE